MSAADWATTLSGFLAVAVAAIASVRWVIKSYLHSYLSELKPNGGSSLNDTIKLKILPIVEDIQSDMTQIKVDLAHLQGRFEQHVDEGE